jgi:hypothetical protein
MASRVILKHQGYEGFATPHFPMVAFSEQEEADLLELLRKAGMEI